ncbi:MAG TPA: hypothetical protein EYH34_02765 [Planctomycetes bacterium]|nr:hypothetical protein [Planctomycetota bacterium]
MRTPLLQLRPLSSAPGRRTRTKRTEVLEFRVSDDLTGPTAGYVFAEAYIDGRPVWSADVGGGTADLLL